MSSCRFICSSEGGLRERMKKRMKKKHLTAAVLGVLFHMCLTSDGFAAEDPDTHVLDETVVTATRTEKDMMQTPASINVITAEDIKRHNVKTLSDALAMLPGVYDARTHGMSEVANGITIRGFGESNILFLYDGMVINDGFSGGMNWNTVAVDDVKRIEVLRGPASSLYGGKAVGAVVNIISKDPDRDGVRAYASYGTRRTWKRGINLSKKIDERWSVSFGYENKRTDGWMKKYVYVTRGRTDTPSNPVATGAVQTLRGNGRTIYLLGTPGTGASEDNTFNFKVKYKFTPEQSLTYRYTHDRYRYFSTNPESYLTDAAGNRVFKGSVLIGSKYYNFDESDFTDYYGRQVVDRHTLQYRDTGNKLIVNAGISEVKESGYSGGDDFAGVGPGGKTSYPSKTVKLDLQKTWDLGRHTVVTGFDIQRDSMDYIKSKLAHWHDHDSVTAQRSKTGGRNSVMAVFVQDDYRADEKFGINVGLRFDRYRKYDGYYHDNVTDLRHEDASYNELSPKVVFSYFPNRRTTLYASFGHSFNPPRLFQLYWYDPGVDVIANPTLKPEKSNTFEIGWKEKFNDKTYLGLSLYHARTKDLITLSDEDADGNRKYVNVDKVKRVGWELELRHRFNPVWSVFANYNYELATDGDDNRIYSIPKHTLHLGIKYDQNPWSAYLEGQYVSSRNEPHYIAHRYLSDDAFFIANIGVNYKFTSNATLSFSVDNLFDRDYWQWYKARGRSFTVGMEFDL